MTIGDSYGGGIIFHIEVGEFGVLYNNNIIYDQSKKIQFDPKIELILIAKTSDVTDDRMAASSTWATGITIGQGFYNTWWKANNCVEPTCGACEQVSGTSYDGYTDWFVGSEDEMVALYKQRNLPGLSGTWNTAINSYYWTSTGYNNPTNERAITFINGGVNNYSSSNSIHVRPIRMEII